MPKIKGNLPDMNNIDIIIEHFCESFALIGYLIGIYPDKHYICNENDEMPIKVYKAIQDEQM